MKNSNLTYSLLLVLLVLFTYARAADPATPDPSPWAFLEGSWTATSPDGNKTEFKCSLSDSKTCYVLESKDFHGIFGIDKSSDKPLLVLSYHPGKGHSIAHFKRESETKIIGLQVLIDENGDKKEHQCAFEMTDGGFDLFVDGNVVSHWEKR